MDTEEKKESSNWFNFIIAFCFYHLVYEYINLYLLSD